MFQLDGHKPANGVVVGDDREGFGIIMVAIVEGLLIVPAIVDLASGAFYSFPDEIHATMTPAEQAGFSTVKAQK